MNRHVQVVNSSPGTGVPYLYGIGQILSYAAAIVVSPVVGLLLAWPELQRGLIYGHWLRPFWYNVRDPCETGKWRFGSARNISISTADGILISGWHFLPARHTTCDNDAEFDDALLSSFSKAAGSKSASRLWIYFHGASFDRGFAFRLGTVDMLKRIDPEAHIVVMEYRGFGDSQRVAPTEAGLKKDAMAVWEWALAKGVPPSQIILFGHSLGTGPATFLYRHLLTTPSPDVKVSASTIPRGLLLFCPYSSMPAAVATHPASFILSPFRYMWGRDGLVDVGKKMLCDKWDSVSELSKIRDFLADSAVATPSLSVNVIVVHGLRDREIPLINGHEMFAALGGSPPSAATTMELPEPLTARDGALYRADIGGAGKAVLRLFVPTVGTHTNLPYVEAVVHVVEAWGRGTLS